MSEGDRYAIGSTTVANGPGWGGEASPYPDPTARCFQIHRRWGATQYKYDHRHWPRTGEEAGGKAVEYERATWGEAVLR